MLTEKASMNGKVRGSLIIVGGHEEKEKEAERAILEELAVRAKRRKGSLVVMTVATQLPEEVASEYRSVFRDLGVRDLDVVDIRSRDDANADDAVEKIRDASVVYFTGGDQLRITSQVGDSPVFRCLNEIYRRGATIAGTSAGAAAMSETMLVSGAGDESTEISALGMAPGLGLLSGVVVDSHFAERGRFGRLLGAVAQNPKNIGLGIDEDTAVVVEREERFRVVGSGAVYVVDGTGVSYSSLSERRAEGILSIFDVKVHVLGDGDTYDLTQRCPTIPDERSEAAG
jgi:cyanophycinase